MPPQDNEDCTIILEVLANQSMLNRKIVLYAAGQEASALAPSQECGRHDEPAQGQTTGVQALCLLDIHLVLL